MSSSSFFIGNSVTFTKFETGLDSYVTKEASACPQNPLNTVNGDRVKIQYCIIARPFFDGKDAPILEILLRALMQYHPASVSMLLELSN